MGEAKELLLSQGRTAKVSAEDYEVVSQFKWYYGARGYAVRNGVSEGKRTLIYLHRELCNPPAHMEVDHVDGDRLNNVRENLRVCTKAENLRARVSVWGSSQYRGVSRRKKGGRWAAYIRVEGKRHHLGTFDSEVQAACCYDAAALHFFGEFARPNFSRGP